MTNTFGEFEVNAKLTINEAICVFKTEVASAKAEDANEILNIFNDVKLIERYMKEKMGLKTVMVNCIYDTYSKKLYTDGNNILNSLYNYFTKGKENVCLGSNNEMSAGVYSYSNVGCSSAPFWEYEKLHDGLHSETILCAFNDLKNKYKVFMEYEAHQGDNILKRTIKN